MKTRIIIKSLAIWLTLLFCGMPPGYAGDLDLSDLQNAKVARHKAVQKRMDSGSDDSGGSSGSASQDEDCGNVDIGNIQGGNKIGSVPRSIDVIITGDVINTGNKCR